FRKMRAIFAPGSPVYADLKAIKPEFVNALIDRVEDVYDDSVHNLDAFAADLANALGDHPIVDVVSRTVTDFSVHYVLNMFNGVKETYETAIKPFVQNLNENESGSLSILNLGWVIAHPDINEANHKRVPIVLQQDARPAEPKKDAAMTALSKIASQYMTRATPASKPLIRWARPDPKTYLDTQLDTL